MTKAQAPSRDEEYSAVRRAAITLVDRAIDAMGGATALANLTTIAIRGQEMVWEHEYSYSAMPYAEVRESSRATFYIRRDLVRGASRIDWDRDIVRLKFRPYPTLYAYKEILADGLGYVEGIDSSTPTALTLLSDPPGSPMSSIRMIVTERELARESPRLVYDAKSNPSLTALGNITVDGTALPAIQFDVAVPGVQTQVSDWRFIVMFDPATSLPARVRTLDGDPIQGTIEFDLVLTEWRDVDGLKIPFHRMYQHNGRDLIETTFTEVAINPALDASLFALPVLARAAAVRSNASEAFTNIPYQWTLRRVKWGGDINTDAVAWDATATAEPRWVSVLPGIDWTDGVTHNSIMVVMKDYLIVWEASLHENFSEWMIRSAKRRYPDKPIRYLVLSHHHLDHNGGARPFVAEGVDIVVPVGPGYEAYFDRMLAPDSPYLNDRLHRHPRSPNLIRVDDTFALSDGRREFMLYNMKHSEHAPGLLIAFIPDVGLLINTDLWNTNEKLGAKPLLRQQELLDVVERWKIKPVYSASGHGPIVPYSMLADIAPAGSRAGP
jgi:glyoxylase-like metal-dependent hydrolase (beta-lactamase superfamily II)